MADSTQGLSGQHEEGIQHIATNTAPPGTEDTHRGTEGGLGTGRESTVGTGLESGGLGTTNPTESGVGAGMESRGVGSGMEGERVGAGMGGNRMEPGMESGGVSSMSSGSNTISPLKPSGESMTQPMTTGTTQPEGGMMGTVKSYLGYGSATGTEAAAPPQVGGDDRVVEASEGTSAVPAGSGSGAGVSSAIGTETDRAAPPQVGGEDRAVESTSAVPAGSGSGAGMSGAAASAASAVGVGSGNEAAGGGLGSTSSTSAPTEQTRGSTGGSTAGVTDTTNTEGSKSEATSGGDGEQSAKSGSTTGKLENPSAIPVAGGERLGEKHWGESKVVPDDPTKGKSSEAGVSSEEGQPTQQTSDNTNKNMGGATGPPGEKTENSGNSGSEEKPSMMDKIKDKMGK